MLTNCFKSRDGYKFPEIWVIHGNRTLSSDYVTTQIIQNVPVLRKLLLCAISTQSFRNCSIYFVKYFFGCVYTFLKVLLWSRLRTYKEDENCVSVWTFDKNGVCVSLDTFFSAIRLATESLKKREPLHLTLILCVRKCIPTI